MGSSASSSSSQESLLSNDEADEGLFQPTIADCISAKELLTSPALKNPLPLEIADIILDHAEYWPCASYTVENESVAGSRDSEDKMVLRTLPLGWYGSEGDIDVDQNYHISESGQGLWLHPRGQFPCRKIEFYIQSHDQGWGGEPKHPDGPFAVSYTWFDVGVDTAANPQTLTWLYSLFTQERSELFKSRIPERPFLSPPYTLQKNRCAEDSIQEYFITWHYLDCFHRESLEAIEAGRKGRGSATLDGSFVRELGVGDCITLWMRARFPGWRNELKKAVVKVYWAV